MSGDDCIFCKIIAGKVPSARVYEDKHVVAFMDIGPVVKGHVLVVPRSHHENILDIPVPVLEKLAAGVKKVAAALKKALKADGINVAQANGSLAGQVVPHIHFHVIPRFVKDSHSWSNPQKKYDSPDEMGEYAGLIRKGVAADA